MVDRRYKDCRTSYGCYLKKRKSVPSGSERNGIPTSAEFASLEWLNNHRAETVTNMAAVPSDSGEEGGDVLLRAFQVFQMVLTLPQFLACCNFHGIS